MRWTTVMALIVLTTPAQLGLAQDAEPEVTAEQAKTAPALSPEQALIKVQSDAFVDAFNKHDAKAVAALWTKDAEYIDDSGTVHTGRDAIEQVYADFFTENPDASIRIDIDSVRQPSDAVAIEDGRALIDPPPSGAPGVSKYIAVHVKVDGQWQMASVRDTWVETPVTRESAADLDWLIGTWTAEENGVRFDSVCRWVANENFVERTHTTTQADGTTSSGVQLIGWNPAEDRVQSWTFSPDGGHALGIWMMTTTGWAAQMQGVTGDGTLTTSVVQLRRLDDNAYVWQSIERMAGGVALPDTGEVVIKRVPTAKQPAK